MLRFLRADAFKRIAHSARAITMIAAGHAFAQSTVTRFFAESQPADPDRRRHARDVREEKEAIFAGNVKVMRGDTTMTS
jgi:lipopolysaccharide export system protein LptA